MNPPFSVEQFLGVFEAYNRAVFPMQLALAASGVVAIILVARQGKISSKIVSAILAFLWLWMGVVYHLVFFSGINRAAFVFGSFFIFQALIFLYAGVLKSDLSFRLRTDLPGVAGAVLMVLALLLYPVAGFLFGHVYPRSPTFGLPCPTTIFTFGLLLWVDKKVPVYVLPIPFLWSLIGFAAAFSLGIVEDAGLVIAGLIGTAVSIWYRPDRHVVC